MALYEPIRRAAAQLRAHVGQRLRDNAGAPVAFDWQTAGVFVATCVLLTAFYYWGRPSFVRGGVELQLAGALDLDASFFRGLLPYWYWALASLVLRVAIPLALIVWWFGDRPRDYGFRMWKPGHGRIYLGLYLVMLPVLVIASFSESFQRKYPFYDEASRSLAHFLGYELAYTTQFFALEAFFRGFVVFALFKRFGYYAVAIMTIPYCMIHFSKPAPETFGAIVAGLVLGYLAVESRSWVPGALLHAGVGVTMDVLCIIQKQLAL